MEHAVLLLHCPVCHGDWLVLDSGQAPPDCPHCWRVPWQVTTSWTLTAASWWPMIDGRLLPVESARHFLWRLSWCAAREHPSGPLGSHVVTLGMQLVPATAPNGDTTWYFAKCAGSDN